MSSRDLDNLAQRISPSVAADFTNLPDVEQLMREADEHAVLAENAYRKALQADADGVPSGTFYHRAAIEQGAAGLCQQRAQLLVLSLALIGCADDSADGRQARSSPLP